MSDPALATAVAEIDRYVAYLQDPEKVWGHIATRAKLGELVVGHWSTIRAALDQMSKRELTVEEQLAEAKPVDLESLAADPPLSDEEFEVFEQALRWPDDDLDERMERLEAALVRRGEVIDIAKLQSVCWFSLTTGQSHDAPRCGGCGSCLLFAALMEFDRQEQEAGRG